MRFQSRVAAAVISGVAIIVALWAGLVVPAPAAAVTVSAVHPYILATSQEFAAISTRSEVSTETRSLQDRVVSKATTLLTTPPKVLSTATSETFYLDTQTLLDRVTTLSIAGAVTLRADFRDRLWDEISPILEMTTWDLSSSLATSTLAYATAVAYDTFHHAWTPAQRASMVTGIADLGLSVAASSYASGHEWTEQPGNLNIVSNAGYATAALAILNDRPAASDVLNDALVSLDEGLRAFTVGGAFPEGPQYWNYAMHHLVAFARAMERATGDDEGLLDSTSVRNTALYPLYVTGPTGTLFSYSDSKATFIDSPALFELGRRFNNPALTKMAFDATQLGSINQFALLWFLHTDPRQTPAQAGMSVDKSFAASGLVSLRSGWENRDAVFVGFKTATPAGNWHPQLDAGTFVLDALGVNWIKDLGPDSYSLPGYFDGLPNGQRWSYYRNRAEGHNTVVINPGSGPDQDPFSNSTVAKFQTAGDEAYAWGYLNSSVASNATGWKRGIALVDARRQVVLQDEITGSGMSVLWGVHTDAHITVAADGRSAILFKNGQELLARIASPAGVRFTAGPAQPSWTSPNPPGQTLDARDQKLSIALSGIRSVIVTVQFTPLRAGADIPALEPVKPVTSWTVPADSVPLTSLTVNGKSVQGFTPITPTYDVAADGLAIPTVAATAAAGVTVAVTPPTAVPGVGTVTATKNGVSTRYFVYVKSGPHRVTYTTSSTSRAAALLTVDKDPITKWVGGGKQTIQYEFDSARTVAQVNIQWAAPTKTTTTYAILTSTNKQTWRTHYASTLPAASGWQRINIPDVQTRYIAILIDPGNASYTGIHEIEFWATDDGGPTAPSRAPVAVHLAPAGTVEAGNTVQLVSTFTAADGQPADLTGYTTTYTTSNPAVASVNATGLVTAISEGTARVGVTIANGSGAVLAAGTDLAVLPLYETVVLNAVADTFVNNAIGSEGENYGSSAGLFVKTHTRFLNLNREAYLAFDLSSLSGRTVAGASVSFYANTTDTGGNNGLLGLYEIDGTWIENEVSYLTKPTLGTPLGQVSTTQTSTQYAVNVTAAVQAALATGTLLDIGLGQAAENGDGLLTVIYGSAATRPPKLTIQLTREP